MPDKRLAIKIPPEADNTPGTTLLQKPTVTIGTYTYNGTSQSPTITGYDPDTMYIQGTSSSTNAGDFTFTIGLQNQATHKWLNTDGTISNEPLTYNWSIGKATPTFSLSTNSVTLNTSNPSATVTITTNSDGVLSATSSDSTIATASISGSTLTIAVAEGASSGNVTVTVSLAASTNYTGDSGSVSVTAELKPQLVSWSSGTDEQIAAMVNGYYEGTLTIEDIKKVWSVGSERRITTSAMAATGVGESHVQQEQFYDIIGFEHDDLTTPINGKTKALITIGSRYILYKTTTSNPNSEYGYMNSTGTNVGGWKQSARRTWCNSVFYNALPSYIKSLVKQVNKISSDGGVRVSTVSTTSDYVFIPSEPEVTGNYEHSMNEGRQYELYNNGDYWKAKGPRYDTNISYWLRTAKYSTAYQKAFIYVKSDPGVSVSIYDAQANANLGITPHFCL